MCGGRVGFCVECFLVKIILQLQKDKEKDKIGSVVDGMAQVSNIDGSN